MKFSDSRCWYSSVCSITWHSTKICSTHNRPLRKPACCFRSRLSTAQRSRFRRTMASTLPGTDRRVTPRQLSHFDRSPFLGKVTMTPCLQSSGTAVVAQHVLSSSVIASTRVWSPALSRLGGIPFLPAALPFLSVRIACLRRRAGVEFDWQLRCGREEPRVECKNWRQLIQVLFEVFSPSSFALFLHAKWLTVMPFDLYASFGLRASELSDNAVQCPRIISAGG